MHDPRIEKLADVLVNFSVGVKKDQLVRVRRGLYVLQSKYRIASPHPFGLAQALEPGSYVSFETALAARGWIPESVHITASVVPGRKSSHLGELVLHGAGA